VAAPEELDPLTRTVEKIKAQLREFFWDAIVALKVNGITGDYVEFGSVGGNTLRLAYEPIKAFGEDRHLWAFDSFESLPESDHPLDDHPSWKMSKHMPTFGGVERFHAELDAAGVPREAYTAVPGWFDDTLPPLGTDGAPRDIALAYVDCNMYSSTVSALRFLAPRLKHGMIVAFDDYNCWSPTHVSGERAALHELLLAHPQWHFHRFADITWGSVAFVVEHAGQVAQP
jgi:O-methyltransferase